MFRRLPQSLPPDPTAPSNLSQLGYFVNDNDQVRKISNPDQKYQYKIDRNERVNEVYREAMNRCIRSIVYERFQAIGMGFLRLPIGAQPHQQHVPILISKEIRSKQRVLVVFGERNQDLGIFSYRVTGDEGIKVGSAIQLVEAINSRNASTSLDTDAQGIILTNPGQLLWYRGGGRAVSDREWAGLPRASAVHEPFRIDPVKNRVPGNETYRDHVAYVFEHVLRNCSHPDAKLDIIGLEYTGAAVVQYLAANWQEWNSRINGLCLGTPQHTLADLPTSPSATPSNSTTASIPDTTSFRHFLATHSRSYSISSLPLESVLPTDRAKYGCNSYASGETMYEEGVMVRGWRSMLDWFEMVYRVEGYEEPVFTVVEVEGDGNNGKENRDTNGYGGVEGEGERVHGW